MNFKKKLKYILPVSIKKTLKYIYYCFQDFISFISGKKEKDYPPKRLNFVGSNEFKKVGDEFLNHFIKIGKLKKSDIVLDIGCGIGRIAIPLTKYLGKGEYFGFEIDKRGIDWCKKNISNKYPNFHFDYIDLYNKFYNKKGKLLSENFVFPYEDNTFDFIFATSVFTHMLPKQIEQYLKEIKRVLKPGGVLFGTWFSIDEVANKNIINKLSKCNFIYKLNDNCFYSHKNIPEAEIGYKENWIKNLLQDNSCADSLKVYHGKWSSRKEGLSYQDIYISEKIKN